MFQDLVLQCEEARWALDFITDGEFKSSPYSFPSLMCTKCLSFDVHIP